MVAAGFLQAVTLQHQLAFLRRRYSSLTRPSATIAVKGKVGLSHSGGWLKPASVLSSGLGNGVKKIAALSVRPPHTNKIDW